MRSRAPALSWPVRCALGVCSCCSWPLIRERLMNNAKRLAILPHPSKLTCHAPSPKKLPGQSIATTASLPTSLITDSFMPPF
jgi:hypothetical protein